MSPLVYNFYDFISLNEFHLNQIKQSNKSWLSISQIIDYSLLCLQIFFYCRLEGQLDM